MAVIYKHGNNNFKKLTALFALQIILGLLPVLLLVGYIAFSLYTEPVIGYVLIAVMVGTGLANIIITKRYNVLLSGFKGEKNLMRTLKKLGSGYTVYSNLPIRYKKNRSELDFLIISERYILIIEVKNHSGYITGKHKDEYWQQRKVYRGGKSTDIEMQNPIKQMRRQRDIVKSILLANNLDCWVDTVLYFSDPSVHLYLDLYDSDNVCSTESELLEFLRTYSSPKPLSAEMISEINRLFMDMSNGIIPHENKIDK